MQNTDNYIDYINDMDDKTLDTYCKELEGLFDENVTYNECYDYSELEMAYIMNMF